MKIQDLSHPICAAMPVYPGTEPPVIVPGCTIDRAGFLENKITMYSHTGTHMDAPAHLLKEGPTLDRFPAEQFFGRGLRIQQKEGMKTIGVDTLEPFANRIGTVDFVLLETGWSRYWGTETYFSNYPVLALDAAQWLSRFSLKGVGFDTISADMPESEEFPIHKAFLRENIIIVENLDLTGLDKDEFLFSCYPLPFKDADGSPVRAVALLD